MNDSYEQQKKELGLEIAQGREALDLSQKDFAERIGLSLRTLSRYESGETVPDVLTYRKMMGLFQNIYYQQGLFIPVSRVKMVAKRLPAKTKNLQLIKTFIFDAVLGGKPSFIYPGRLSNEEIYLLSGLGYKVEYRESSFIISNL